MESTVYLKNLHISPKKLRFIMPAIKKMSPAQSLEHLFYAPQKGARVFYKAIKSAIDNAKYTLKVNADLLEFKTFTVEQGNALKRFRPGGRGTAKPYKKKFAHIKIVLKVKEGAAVAKPKAVASKTVKADTKTLKVDTTKKSVVKAAPKKAKQPEK